MVAYAIVPKGDIVLAPLETEVHLLGRGDNFVEVGNDVIAFYLWNADDFRHESRIEVERFPACDWMDSNQRVLGRDGIASHCSFEHHRALRLNVCRVECCEGFEILLHWCRKCVISGILGGPECIAASASWGP